MKRRRTTLREKLKRRKPQSDEELWWYIKHHCGYEIPRTRIRTRRGCRDHVPPFTVTADAFFDRVGDFLVWACRSGCKTLGAALLTVLEGAHKPGIQCRILGGSKEQSKRMYEHFEPQADRNFRFAVRGDVQRELTRFQGGGMVAILAASATNVLGHHIPRLRLDEIDQFDPDVLQMAYGTSQSMVEDSRVKYRGRIEAYSTFHNTYGPMQEELDRATARGTPIYRWCIFEVLEHCGPERECDGCVIREDCMGVAKRECNGYYLIDDACRMKQRHSKQRWEAFYLCTRPYTGGLFYGEFDEDVHVAGERFMFNPKLPLYRGWDWGTKEPTVCLWAQREKLPDGRDMFTIVDEHRVRGKSASVAAKLFADHHKEHFQNGRVPAQAVRDIGDCTGSVYIAEYRRIFREQGLAFNFSPGRSSHRRDETSFRESCHECVRHKLCSGDGRTSILFNRVESILSGTRQDGELLQGTVPELKALHYAEKRAGQRPTEDYAKVDDHGADALGYLCVALYPPNEWKFVHAEAARRRR